MFRPAIVIYDEASRQMCMAAALSNWFQLFDKAYRPVKGQGRVILSRSVFERGGLAALEARIPR